MVADDVQEDVYERFFALQSWEQLDNFLASLDPVTPLNKALRYYAGTWTPFRSQNFNPDRLISRDFAAVMYGKCPAIFQGSNCWAEQSYVSDAVYEEIVNRLVAHCTRLRAQNSRARLCLIVVPEKDYLISSFFLGESRFAPIKAAFDRLHERLRPLDITLFFDEPLRPTLEQQTLADLEYHDTHLDGTHYRQFFSAALAALGHDPAEVQDRLGTAEIPAFHDLYPKFNDGANLKIPTQVPDFAGAEVIQTSGDPELKKPLGDIRQSFANAAPCYDDTITILGDSHSSIFAQHRLTYLLASAFKTADFSWNPMGTRQDSAIETARNIVLEISMRFLFTRPQHARVMVNPEKLEAQAMQRQAIARAIWRLDVDEQSLPADLTERNAIFMAGYPEHLQKSRKLEQLLTGLGYKIVPR